MTAFRKTTLACLAILILGSCTKVVEYLDDTLNSEFHQLWTERVEQIVHGCTTDYEKAKAIYEWECANIAYDLDYRIYTAEECWDQKKGVCQAYCELFVRLASHCDLEAEVLSGKCRTLFHLDGDGSHAWVKVKTEKGWILIDATWGAGYVSTDHSLFTFYDHNMSWFDVDSEIMVFTHFPNNQQDQLLDEPVTEEQYKGLPLVEPQVVVAGWDGREVLNYFMNHPGVSAPTFYIGFTDGLGKFELVQMPYSGNMRVGETYILKIRTLELESNAMVGSWGANNHDWEQDGDLFTLEYKAVTEGELHIYLDGYGGIMKYEVTD